VATKIKLQRLGKMREPHYRIVIADSRAKRDGRVIESIGQYHPKADPSVIVVNADRARHWLSVGAQPTEAVVAILKVTGDWQAFRGEPAPPPMKVAAARPNKRAVFEEAARAAAGLEDKPATTARAKKAPAKAAAPETAAVPEASATAAESAPAAETPAAETPAETPPAAAAEAPSAEAAPAADTAPEPPAEPAAEA
jgi:small subunit ribosomal protein S16